MTKQSRVKRKERRAQGSIESKTLMEGIEKTMANYKANENKTYPVLKQRFTDKLIAIRNPAYDYLIS